MCVRLNGSVRVNSSRLKRRALFVISAYAPTDCSTSEVKDEFYRELSQLLQNVRATDVVVVAGDFNAQLGRLDESERYLGGRFTIPANRTDNDDRLLQLCTDHNLFLANTNFSHKKKHLFTWRPPSSSQSWTQIDHIAIGYRWRGSVQDCRSYWSTQVDSDHALVRARFYLRLSGGRSRGTACHHYRCLQDDTHRSAYQGELSRRLAEQAHPENPNECWLHIKENMLASEEATRNLDTRPRNKRWISTTSVTLLNTRRLIPPDSMYNEKRKTLRRQITRSLKNDREQWWIAKCKEMEKAAAIGDSRSLFRLIKNVYRKRPTVSELIKEVDGSLI